MSKTVDERVVAMRFDNTQFEKNVQTSMSTLDKLKQKLNLSGAAKGLDDISNAAKRTDLSGLGNGIESVKMKFSALQVMGVTALSEITRTAMSSGKKIVSALTLDPVKNGFSEYETQMNSVQTILANTSKEGTTVKDVNAALGELNTYADKTIYNFTEMTRNIGTFTAAGVKLDDSVNAIQGIANLAAVSGSNSQQASTAMYQLSQALAAGKVNLQDWNSVVNAGMGGKVFQDALIRTSEHLKTGAKQAIKTKGSFRESIQTGWMTQEVLTETLSQFSTAADTQEEYEAAIKKFVGQGYTKQEAKEMADMARTAGNAATKVKTFTQLIDTLKEALGSGWTRTWQLIIGDFEEAKKLWTSVSDVLGKFIKRTSHARNKLIKSTMGKSFIGLAKKLQGVAEPAEKVTKTISKLGDVTDKVINGDFGSGKSRFDALTKAGFNYYKVQNKVNEKIGNSKRYTEEQIKAQDKLLESTNKTVKTTDNSTKATSKLTEEKKNLIKKMASMTEEQMRSKGYADGQIAAFKELGETADKLGMPLNEFIDNLDKITGRWILINSFKNIGKSLVNVFKTIGNAWSDTFKPMSADKLFDIIAAFHKMTQSMKQFTSNEENVDKLTRTFKGLFAAIDIVRTVVGGGISLTFKLVSLVLKQFNISLLDITANIGDVIVKFRDFLFNNDLLVKGAELLASGIKFVATKFKELFGTIKNLPKVQEFLTNLKNINFKEIGTNIIEGLKNGLKDGVTSIPKMLIDLGGSLLDAIKGVLGIHSPSRKMYDVGTNIVLGLSNGIKDAVSTVINTLKELGSKCIETVKNIDWSNLFSAGVSVALLVFIKKIINIMDNVTKPMEGVGNVLDSASKVISKSSKGISKIFKNTAKVVKSFSKVLNAKAFKIKAEAIKDLAISIGILALSVYLLAQLDTGKLKSAVVAIVVLSLVMVVLAVAINKISDASVSISEKGINVSGVKTALIAIGAALLMMAATVKMIGSLNLGQAIQGFVGLLGCVVLLISVIGAFGHLVKGENAVNIDKLGKMMTKLAVALLLMAIVVKIVGKLSGGEMLKGAAFVAGFTVFVWALTAITRLSSNGVAIDGLGSMMVKLSLAMLLMVGVVKMVGKLSGGDMLKGVAFATAFVIFVGLLTVITNFTKGTNNLGGMMLKISAAMLLMVGVVKLIGQLSPSEMVKGGAFAAAFLVFLYFLVKITTISNDQQIAKVAGTIMAVSIALAILAGVSIILGMLDITALAKGVGAVAILGVLMAYMIKATKDANDVKGNIMAFAVAIAVMAVAVAALSLIDVTQLAVAVASLSALMIMFGVMAKLSSNAGEAMGSLIVMTVVVALLGGLLIALTQIPTQQALVAAGALSVVLLSLAGAMWIISNTGDVSAKAILTLAMMAIIVLALTALVSKLIGIASMPIANIAASMLLLAGAMAVIAVAVNLMNGSIAGAAALIIVTAALTVFLPVLQQLGAMSLGEVGTSLLMLAGTFAVLGVAGLLLAPISPILVVLGTAVSLLGAGAMMAGVGVKSFAEGIQILANTNTEQIQALTNTLTSLADAIPKIVATFVMSFIESVTQAIPQVVNCGLTMIEQLLKALSSKIPSIVSLGMKTVISFLSGIRDNIKKIVTTAADILINFINGISEKLPDVIQAGVDLVFAFIDGISDAIANNGDRARESMIKLGKAMLTAIKDFFGIHSPSKVFMGIGGNLIDGLKNGIANLGPKAVSKLKDIGKNMIKGIGDKAKGFLDKGKELAGKLKDGIDNKKEDIKKGVSTLVEKAADKAKTAKKNFEEAGKDLMSGLKSGIENMKEKIKSVTKGISDSVIGKFKDLMGIHSPSRVFFGFGKNIDEGLINGLRKYSSKVSNATEYVGRKTLKGMTNAMKQVTDLIDSDMDTQPTVRPVVDLSDVKTGAKAINGMLNRTNTIGLRSEIAAVSATMQNRQNGNHELLSAIKGLRKDMSLNTGTSVNVQLDYNAGSDANEIANDIAVNLRRAIRRGV